LASVAAAAAVAAGVRASLTLSAAGPGAVLPGVGAVPLPGAAPNTVVRLRGGLLECDDGTRAPLPPPARLGREHPGWWPLRAVTDGGAVLDDADAVTTAQAAPARLTGAELRSWRAEAGAALRLLRARHAEYAGEVAAGLRALTPVTRDDGDTAHHSGSSAEMFGGVALSRPAGPRAVAETLVHEMQHSKLLAVTHLVDLLAPIGPMDEEPLHYAPWREDPRPLPGLLHGTYAFLAVARFWAVEAAAESDPLERHRAQVRCARWRAAAAGTAGAILAGSDDRLTPAGRRFVTGTARALARLGEQPLPASAVREADRQAEEHRGRWSERSRP
jgi:HEXXH motif-containing protein